MTVYKEMVSALAKWHNAAVDVTSDEVYRRKGEPAWRWIRLVDAALAAKCECPAEAVYSGAGAKRLPKRRRNARRIVEAVLSASGYCFDIQRIHDIKVPPGKRYRYRFCVYDMSSDAPGYDADAYETVEKGRRDRRMAWFDVTIVSTSTKWLYGHRGFKTISVSTYSELPGPVPEPRPICSEAECFGMFVDDMLNGYLNSALPRIPRISSEEELKLWLATVGS